MKIGILGTRGIPNHYGGFEQFAQYLSVGLVARGHEVYVYNSSLHPYQEPEYHGVKLIHCEDTEDKMGTAGQFIYDFNCFKDARRRPFDLLLQLGYTSSSVWYWMWPKKMVNMVNMDGLEWKRSKYSPKVQWFLKHAERWAAKHGDVLIADSLGIQTHLQETYRKPSIFIPYGAELFDMPRANVLSTYGVQPYQYHLLIARMEPENNIEMIIKGYLQSQSPFPLMIVGKTDNKFGQYLRDTYTDNRLRFVGGIYDMGIINNLRHYSQLYFHGHSVGGTNPSLLEAMAADCLIAAHDNVFNQTVLQENAFYFGSPEAVTTILDQVQDKNEYRNLIEANRQRITTAYNWEKIIDAYEAAMLEAVKKKKG
jgi:glycosyltransferase involved in cell wall biosynthesis